MLLPSKIETKENAATPLMRTLITLVVDHTLTSCDHVSVPFLLQKTLLARPLVLGPVHW